MKIRNNLYLLSGGVYGVLGNVYMVPHDEGCVLIDCGIPNAFQIISDNLQYFGYSVKDVTHVLLTHGHDDHAGTAAYFQKEGAKIVVGKEDAYMLLRGDLGENTPFRNHKMPKCDPDILIDTDTTLHIGGIDIDVYCTSGHSNGSLTYYIKAKDELYLLTGDLFCVDGEKGDQAHIWWKGDMDYNSEKLGESLKKLWNLELNPTVIAGGHANPRIGEGTKDSIMIAYKEYLLTCRG